MPAPVPCRGCGMMIEFHEGPNGKPIPLQRVRRVYEAAADGASVVLADLGEGTYVSHFETCPKARDFSGKGRR